MRGAIDQKVNFLNYLKGWFNEISEINKDINDIQNKEIKTRVIKWLNLIKKH